MFEELLESQLYVAFSVVSADNCMVRTLKKVQPVSKYRRLEAFTKIKFLAKLQPYYLFEVFH